MSHMNQESVAIHSCGSQGTKESCIHMPTAIFLKSTENEKEPQEFIFSGIILEWCVKDYYFEEVLNYYFIDMGKFKESCSLLMFLTSSKFQYRSLVVTTKYKQ